MVTQSITTRPHPYLQQFEEFAQLDQSSDTNYYTLNSSLWAAQKYIEQRFDINIFAENNTIEITEDYYGITYSKILSVRKDNNILLPKLNYFNSISNSWEVIYGDYTLKDGQFSSSTDIGIMVNTVNGWVLPASPFTSKIDNESVGTAGIATPYITINNLPAEYPTFLNVDSVDITIHGTVDSNIIVNEVDTGIVMPASGEYVLTVDTSTDIVSTRIRLQNPVSSTYSSEVKLLFIKAEDVEPYIVILDNDIVSNNGICNLLVYSNKVGTINGDSVLVGTNKIAIPITANTTKVQLSTSSGVSNTVMLLCKLDTTLTDEQCAGYNKKLEVPIIPNDLLVGFFRTAYHFFQEALGKNDKVDRYSSGTGQAITFNGHRLPKDVVNILSSYMIY